MINKMLFLDQVCSLWCWYCVSDW